MSSRRWLALVVALVAVVIAAAVYGLPGLVRYVLVAQVHAITHRPVRVDRVDVQLLKGQFVVHGFRLDERDGRTPFADFDRLDVRVHLPSLLRGHLWIREIALRNSTVRVIRFPNEFNFSDLIQSSGTSGRTLDITVDRFALEGGTVTLEDRALSQPRTWTSENIHIEAHNLSTRRNDGRAVGSSVTGGAPVSVEVEHLRLAPIELQATVTVKGLDLSLARLYLPPAAPVILDRGRASTTLKVALNPRGGIRADVTGQIDNLALVKPNGGEAVALVPKLTAQVTNFVYEEGRVALGRFELAGAASVLDPTAGPGRRFEIQSVRASVAELTWPVTAPGKLDVSATFSGGSLSVTGSLQAPPAPSQLRLRLANLDLAPWARFVPVSARISGVAEADLRTNEALAPNVPTRVAGIVAVNRLGVRDDRQELLAARRVEASGLEVQWPTRLRVKQLLVSEPRAKVERDRAGAFPLVTLWSPAPATPVAPPATPVAQPSNDAGKVKPSTAPALALGVDQIVVRGGAVSWRDDAVKPAAALDFSRIDASVAGVGWPLRGPADVRLALQSPAGGQLHLAGRVGVDPLSAELRVSARDIELAPYRPYAPPTPARITGRAQFDLAVRYPASSPGSATVRGDAALSRLDIRDEQRTVVRAERAAATGLIVEWPERVTVRQVTLERPWVLLERDEKGALTFRALLPTAAPAAPPSAGAPAQASDGNPASNAEQTPPAMVVTVRQLVMEEGGARVVDRSVSPPFALDLDRLALQMDGFSTAAAKPSRLEVTGRAGRGSDLSVRGAVRPAGGPLYIDVNAELRGFAVPRANPYLLRNVAWEARDGWLYTTLRCRVDGDALNAKTDIRLSRLQVARAGPQDQAEARLGLPLGLIVSLLKDSRGGITVSLPVGGKLSDPRFDFSEAIWHAVRTVAVKAITAPVSWIGRVHLDRDSRIERIQIDPIRFRPGTVALTPDGQEQVERLSAFLKQVPDVRISLTPVVSPRDLAELSRAKVNAAVERAARETGASSEAAAARLFEQRFPDRPRPDTPEAVLAALADSELATAEGPALAARRVEVVREAVKQSGIDPARLPQSAGAAAEGTVAAPGPADSQITLDLVDPDSSSRGRPELRNSLKNLSSDPPAPARG